MAKKKTKEKKEKVCEIFEVKEAEGEKTIKSCGKVEEKHASEKQLKEQNKILRNLFIGIGILILLIMGWIIGAKMISSFEYAGLEWNIMKEGDITFYHTILEIKNKTRLNYHHVYFRTDPRKLIEKVELEGEEIKLTKAINVESREETNCEGYGIVSQAAFEQVLNAWGIQVFKDPEANCDSLGRYNYIIYEEGEKTKIKSIESTCHVFYINNCEVFEVKERFLLEEMINRYGQAS